MSKIGSIKYFISKVEKENFIINFVRELNKKDWDICDLDKTFFLIPGGLRSIIFNIDINRKTFNHLGITDYNFYFGFITPILLNLGIIIESMTCDENIWLTPQK